MPSFTVFKGSKDGSIKKSETSKPELKGDQVLLKVTASGVCGTDLHYRQGIVPSAIATKPRASTDVISQPTWPSVTKVLALSNPPAPTASFSRTATESVGVTSMTAARTANVA